MNINSYCFRRVLATLALIVLFALFIAFFALLRPVSVVCGSSMNPTFSDFQVVTSSPLAFSGSDAVQRNDIVVARNRQKGYNIVKRVIAVPGDTLAIWNNRIILNGHLLQEDYLAEPMVTADIPLFTVPEGQYFLLGDNRNVSADSRSYGLFAREDLLCTVCPHLKVLPVLILAATIYIATQLTLLADDKLRQWANCKC